MFQRPRRKRTTGGGFRLFLGKKVAIDIQWQPQQQAVPVADLSTLGAFLALTPTQFEIAIGEFLQKLGCSQIQHTGKGGDLMADLTCVTPYGETAIVQCKRYGPGHSVGTPDIQKFIGMVYQHHGVQKGIFVTTSSFTEQARQLAAQHNIGLIDGQQLIQYSPQG